MTPAIRCFDGEIVNAVTELEPSIEEEHDVGDTDDGKCADPTHTKAFSVFEMSIRLVEKQPECSITQLSLLRSIRHFGAQKRITTLGQKTITDFFTK